MFNGINVLIDDYADMDFRSKLALNGIHENASIKKTAVRTFFSTTDLINTLGRKGRRFVIVISESKVRAENLLTVFNGNNIHPIFINMQFFDAMRFFSNVTPNYYTTIYQLSSMIIREYPEPCAFIGYNKDSLADKYRMDGFKNACEKYGVEYDIFSYEGDMDRCIDRAVSKINNYRNIICTNDITAILLMSRMKKLGYDPENYNITGCGNMKIGEYFKPPLSTVVVDYFSSGFLAVDIYTFLVKRIQIQNLYINSECKIIFRDSTHLTNLSTGTGEAPAGDALIDFYHDKKVHEIDVLERMFRNCDDTDIDILRDLLADATLEKMAETSMISVNTVKYRIKKMRSNLMVKSRKDIIEYIKSYDLDPYFPHHNPARP
jgi:DNA-binding LacI/PurR family transcriptional regulator